MRKTGIISSTVLSSLLLLFPAAAQGEEDRHGFRSRVATSENIVRASQRQREREFRVANPDAFGSVSECESLEGRPTNIRDNRLKQALSGYITSDDPVVGAAEVVFSGLGYVGSKILPDAFITGTSNAGEAIRTRMSAIPTRWQFNDTEIRLASPDLDVGNLGDMEVSVGIRFEFGARGRPLPKRQPALISDLPDLNVAGIPLTNDSGCRSAYWAIAQEPETGSLPEWRVSDFSARMMPGVLTNPVLLEVEKPDKEAAGIPDTPQADQPVAIVSSNSLPGELMASSP